MNKETYCLLENFMISCMTDTAHDKEHVYRVLYNALEIAEEENNVNYDILIAACLLHDIGRKEQFKNPALCHAIVGSEKAYQFLLAHGFEMFYAEQVKQCIKTHRYRKNNHPQSLEAKILFDADKLDVAGAIGIARTLLYKGIVSEPLYTVLPDGTVSTGENDTTPSFFQEYKYKLEKLYSNFYTKKAKLIARERKHSAIEFYNSLYQEISFSYKNGINELNSLLEGSLHETRNGGMNKMTEVKFYDNMDDKLLKFAVIIAKAQNKYVFCKHKSRDTWEIPGGHREHGETIIDTAKRELYEETGALEFDIQPVCVYSVTAPNHLEGGKESFGMLFFADVKCFETELHSEIEKITITDRLPEKWTYPNIQPHLMEEAKKRGYL